MRLTDFYKIDDNEFDLEVRAAELLRRWKAKWASDNSSPAHTSEDSLSDVDCCPNEEFSSDEDCFSDEYNHLVTHDTLAQEWKQNHAPAPSTSMSGLLIADPTESVKIDPDNGTPCRRSNRKRMPCEHYAKLISWSKVNLRELP